MPKFVEAGSGKTKWYTVMVGMIFLGVMIGMLYMMFFVAMPASNEKPIMLVCGALVTAAVIALNNMARGGTESEDQITALKNQVEDLKTKLEAVEAANTELRDMNKFLVAHMTQFERSVEDSQRLIEHQRRPEE